MALSREVQRTIQDIRKRGLKSVARKVYIYGKYGTPMSNLCELFDGKIHSIKYRNVSPPIDYISIQEISPDRIQQISPFDYYWGDVGEIRRWNDGNYQSFTDTEIYQCFKNHFEQGIVWENTKYVSQAIEDIDNGIVREGCRTKSELLERYDRLDQLYDRVDKNGYKRSVEVSERDDPMANSRRKNYLNKQYDEVKVDIAANGEYLFRDGYHRLCIAKLLDVDYIPVVILLRHMEWIARREKKYKNETDSEKINQSHPDIPI